MQPDRQSGMLQAITPRNTTRSITSARRPSLPTTRAWCPTKTKTPVRHPTPEQLAAEGAGDMGLLPEEAGQEPVAPREMPPARSSAKSTAAGPTGTIALMG